MRKESRIWAIFLAFAVILLITKARAQQESIIVNEMIIGSGTLCSTQNFEESGTFSDLDGQIVRHCVMRSSYAYTQSYVTSSYFEPKNGTNNACSHGGESEGSFIGNYSGERLEVYLCVERELGEEINISEAGIRSLVINSRCQGDYYNTGVSVQVLGGDVVHCALGGGAPEEVEPDAVDNLCSLTNARWINYAGEEIASIEEGSNVSMIADVSESCEIGRRVRCRVYKNGPWSENDLFTFLKLGEIELNGEDEVIARCEEWNALKLRGHEDDDNQSYFFEIFFSNDGHSMIKSGNITLLNGTITEIVEMNGSIFWNSSKLYDKKYDCPHDKFAVRLKGDEIYCADFWAGNSKIKWGDVREIGGGLTGKTCPQFSAIVGIKGRMKCAVMEHEDGRKVVREYEKYNKRDKSEGCESDEVIYALNVFHNRCAYGLHLEDEDDASDSANSGGDSGGANVTNNEKSGWLKGLWGFIGDFAGRFLPGIFSKFFS